MGSSVKRPMRRGVSSPNRTAAQACCELVQRERRHKLRATTELIENVFAEITRHEKRNGKIE
jgi:hypothetical protein